MSRHKITQSDNPAWRTPEWLREAVRREYAILLDACADSLPGTSVSPNWLGPGSPILEDALCGVPWVDIARDGIIGSHLNHDLDPAMLRWPRAAIWCNPPYSRTLGIAIAPWVEQCAIAGRDITVLGLLPHAHQTRWWAQFVESPDPRLRAAEIRAFPFRIKFDPPPDYAGEPTGSNVNHALVIWSPHTAHFTDPWTPLRARYDPRPRPASADRAPDPSRTRRGRTQPRGVGA